MGELKPTSARDVPFQSDYGPFDINLRSVGNQILMEWEQSAWSDQGTPALTHWQDDRIILLEGMMLLNCWNH